MIGLSTALSSALSGLLVSSGKTSVLSTNITRANEEGYSRKSVQVATDVVGNPRITNISRSSQRMLFDKALTANSGYAGQEVQLQALQRLHNLVGDVEEDGSVAWSMAQLRQALLDYEATPSSAALANQAVQVASGLASSLRAAATEVQSVRADADAAMAASVANINTLLARIQDVNKQVVNGLPGSAAVADALDQRDMLVKELSAEIGIKVVPRNGNDIAIYTDSGVTLFDVTPRSVTFNATPTFDATVQGNAVYADGVRIVGGSAQMAVTSGKLLANAAIRDQVATTQAVQLDEMARGLITLFAERDQQIPATLPDAMGLFTASGAPAVPTSIVAGLAAQLNINPLFDLRQGGDPRLLRDGGANGANYIYNASAVAGFQARLGALAKGFDNTTSFSSATELPPNQSLMQLAGGSAGWIEGLRATAGNRAESTRALRDRAESSLSNAMGVNLDQEMALLLETEKSYQASAKVMGVINGLYSSLFGAVG